MVRAAPFLLRVASPGLDESIQVCVRPEHLRLGPAGSGGAEARVQRVLARRGGATVLLAAGGINLEAWVADSPTAPEPS
jgi:hypothetical protein